MSASLPEPVAITGIGCRFPGNSDSPDQLWTNLTNGFDAVQVIGKDRFNLKAHYHPRPGARRRTYSKWAGLVDRFDQFDPGFFRISPREAAYVDPQHRYLLETAWRALEDGGHVLDLVEGSPVGVFVGISTLDYNVIQTQQNVYEPVGIYNTTGSIHSIAANRISYVFNLKGPSWAVDTACSSSLIAIHQACQSLQNGECEVALAGGVNAILGPSVLVCFSRMGMLSPRGRCFAFDERADGFVRGEGAGMLLLKPLEKALAQGDRIYAVIRGTGVNQDGRTNGITVPSREAQQELTRQTCQAVGVDPEEIVYAEAHGTGTPVGDPIEAEALGSVLGRGRSPRRPCLVGSIKTNIGHLEAGSGVAGIIKAALVLKNRRIPPSLHFRTPNPRIDFDGLRLKVVTETMPLPETGQAPLAMVNSFGFGGANANAVLQGAPERKPNRKPVRRESPPERHSRSGLLLPLSANSSDSFAPLAAAYRQAMEANPGVPMESWCLAAARGQTHFVNRQVLMAENAPQLLERLEDVEKGRPHPDIVEGALSITDRKTSPVWVFSGQGPQWYAMGRELLETEPVFRAAVQRCHDIMAPWGDWSLLEEMLRPEAESRIGNTAIAQPAIFALQVGLADLLRSWGHRPGAVMGHSVGEAAAAYCSGRLSLEDACRVIFHRGAAMQATPLRGRMLVASLPEEEAARRIAPYEGLIDLAAVNSPGSVTLSGDGAALERLARELEDRQVFHQFLKVSYAFHSYHMEPALEHFDKDVGPLDLRTPDIPIYSTVTGKQAGDDDFGMEYWLDNIREPVRFLQALQATLRDGHRHYFEVGPHPVLVSSIQECLRHEELSGVALGSLKRGEPERRQLRMATAQWFTHGFDIDWEALLGTRSAAAPLPPYPWKPARYWHEPEEQHASRVQEPLHSWLHSRLPSELPVWHTILDRDTTESIRDHIIQKTTVFPASAYIESALEAGALLFPGKDVVVEDVTLIQALFLPEKASLRYQFSYDPRTLEFRSHSLDMKDPVDWSLHCQGKLRQDPRPRQPARVDVEAWKEQALFSYDGSSAYETVAIAGFHYGPGYRGLHRIHRGQNRSLVEVELPPEVTRTFSDFVIHPCLLDQAFQACFVTGPDHVHSAIEEGYLPVGCGRVRLFQSPRGKRFLVASELTYSGGNVCRFRMTLTDPQGEVIAEIEDFETRSALKTEHSRAIQQSTWLYQNRWTTEPASASSEPDRPVLGKEISPPTDPAPRQTLHQSLNRLAIGYAVQVLGELGLPCRPDGTLRTATLHRKFSRGTRTARRIAEWLDRLAEHAPAVTKHDSGWTFRLPARFDSGRVWERALHRNPRAYPELLLLRTLAARWARVLAGKHSPAALLAVPEIQNLLEQVDRDSLTWQADKDALAALLADWCRTRRGSTAEAPLQVIHGQGGSGGLATHLLSHLGTTRVDYQFLEADEDKLAIAEKHFFDHPQVTTRMMKTGAALKDSGLHEGKADLVILENPKPRSLLRHLRWGSRLLKPGGAIVVVGPRSVPLWMAFFESVPPLPDRAAEIRQVCHQAGLENLETPKGSGTGLGVFAARKPQVPKESNQGLSLSSFGAGTPSCTVFFSDRGGVCKHLQIRIQEARSHGLTLKDSDAITVTPGQAFRKVNAYHLEIRPGEREDIRRLFRELEQRYDINQSEIIYGWSMDVPGQTNAESLDRFSDRVLVPLLHLAQFTGKDPLHRPSSIHVLTRGAHAVGDRATLLHPAAALLPGFFRCWLLEAGKLNARLVDLDLKSTRHEIDRLVEILTTESGESEVALRQDKIHYLRVDSASMAPPPAKPSFSGYRLEVTSPGMMDSLQFLQWSRRAPGAGQVEVEIQAAALNFRDVLKTLDLYPSDLDRDKLIGDECAGRVTRVERGVKSVKPGDAVLLTGAGCFASHIVVPEEAVLPQPDGIGFEEAVTMPVAFLTAHYALCHLGQIRKAESILIQAGTGGVGLAAIQIARQAGATIFATAGDPGKRQFLEYQGVAGVFDSRSIAFEEEVRAATDGRGVDLVLNSLAGQAIEKGIACLAPFGRFLEIGKRDIYANTPIGLRPFRNNISMHVIDLGVFLQQGGESYRALLKEVQEHFRQGRYRPLPYRVFSMSRAPEALRTMAQAKHMGKIVLRNDGHPIPVRPRPVTSFDLVSPEGAYLVTGGMGGFGKESVKWLCRQGAGHVYAVGRQVRDDDATRELQRYAADRGTVCHLVSCDVSRPEEVDSLFTRIRHSGVPLRGIIHSAVVLDDAMIPQLDGERLRRVIQPKATGAWNLHEASQDHRLDFFVMYSSIVSLLGNVGQVNYGAANSFLDALSHHRRAMGLPSLTVNWGQLAEVGIAARDEKLAALLKKRGFAPLHPESALKHLERLLANQHVQTGVVPVDWSQFFATWPAQRSRPYFAKVAASAEATTVQATGSLRDLIIELPVPQRLERLVSLLQEEIATVLRSTPSRIAPNRSLSQLGLDSLMTFELILKLENAFEIALPTGRLKAGNTIEELAYFLLDLIQDGTDDPGRREQPKAPGTENEPLPAGAEAPVSAALPEGCRVVLRRGRKRSPLFAIHTTGGRVEIYHPLAGALPASLPFEAIQSRVWVSHDREFETMDELSDAYARTLQTAAGGRPLRLLGFSVGGYFARAITRQIEDQGGQVEWLGLIDCLAESNDPKADTPESLALRYSDAALAFVSRLNENRADRDELRDRMRPLVEELLRLPEGAPQYQTGARWFIDQGWVPDHAAARTMLEEALMVWEHHARLVKFHSFQPVAADVHHWISLDAVQAEQSGYLRVPEHFTRGAYREVPVPAHHYDLIREQQARRLGSDISRLLKERETTGPVDSPAPTPV